jgi:hypothetical protein
MELGKQEVHGGVEAVGHYAGISWTELTEFRELGKAFVGPIFRLILSIKTVGHREGNFLTESTEFTELGKAFVSSIIRLILLILSQ